MRTLTALIAALVLARGAAAQKPVSFPTEDGGKIYAGIYEEGGRAIVLAHGGERMPACGDWLQSVPAKPVPDFGVDLLFFALPAWVP